MNEKIFELLDLATDGDLSKQIQIVEDIYNNLFMRRQPQALENLVNKFDQEIISCKYCGAKKQRCEFKRLCDIDGIGSYADGSDDYFCEECLPKAFPTYSHYCILCGKHFWWRVGGLCKECKAETQNVTEYRRVRSQNYRTKNLGLQSDLQLYEWLEILKKYDYKCAYCRSEFEVLDHIVPVSKGGGTTKNNVVPSCIYCNSAKHDQVGWSLEMEMQNEP